MSRIVRLQWLCVLALSVLLLRLVHLQVIRGAYYRQLADQNRLRLVPEQAPRGMIVDRRGHILASNQTLFRVALVPQDVEDLPSILSHVSALVHRSVEHLTRSFKKARGLPFVPATIVPRISKDTALSLEEEQWRFPGLLVRSETIRHYPAGMSAAHLLGYLSQPTEDEWPVLKSYGIRSTQLVGRMGLERLLDDVLRGRSGGVMVEVDHQGREVRLIGQRPSEEGTKVVLTIDVQLQSLIEQVFGAQPGAAVVLDPHTGEVLAMVSVPTFDPEAFVTSDGPAVGQLLSDPLSPLMNRAAVGVYQPGSIMKLITAGAALEQNVITPQTTIVCQGSIRIGDRVFHCWNHDGHGPLNLREALMQSCNVYFMHVGMRLGASRLLAAMEKMGLSHRTGWLLEEQAGHLPRRRLSEGEVAMLAIGQGEVLVTVLQAAVMAATFANEGWLVEPWVVSSIGDHHPVVPRATRHRLGWSQETLEAVRAGMTAVVQDPDGTGRRAFSAVVSIAGKTGTAQTHIPGQSHGWFVGFCPIDHPRVAMAIVSEHGGSGGDLPAEIAKTVCEYISAPGTL